MRPAIRYSLISLAVFLGVFVVALLYARTRLDPLARDYIVRVLEARFRSDVELGDLKLTLFPTLSATATGVKVRHHGRTDVPPLIQIETLVVGTGYLSLVGSSKHVKVVELKGLRIHVPPKSGAPKPAADEQKPKRKPPPDVLVEKIVADGTVLRVLPKNPAKQPMQFDIRKLTMESVGPRQPMNFRATLTNAKPPGDIQSQGRFGPWNGDDPGQTFVEGRYTFRDADLSVFKGIAGILSSDGTYGGVLERLDVNGTTDTPDFRLGNNGNPVPLKTRFHAVVDGTNGDTLLQPVEAQLGTTSIVCRGGVTGTPGVKGKTVALDATVQRGRIDDLLRLAVKSKRPPLIGATRMKFRMTLPPGDRDVVEKLQLKGTFDMDRVSFTSTEIQSKVEEMSQRARGQLDEDPERVASHFTGVFALRDGSLRLDQLTFQIPGAHVELAGTYGLQSEQIDMRGEVRMQARLSQTVKGIKSFLLKAVDPFFAKRGAGAIIPIKISGTRDKPSFGLNLRGK